MAPTSSKPPGKDWRYRTVAPVPNRCAADELAGHRFRPVVATAAPWNESKQVWYQAGCSCGKWRDSEWYRTKMLARRRFPAHIAIAARQQVIF